MTDKSIRPYPVFRLSVKERGKRAGCGMVGNIVGKHEETQKNG
jgi:hypothetical protein